MKKNKTGEAERKRVAELCFDGVKGRVCKLRGIKAAALWEKQQSTVKDEWLVFADWHIAKLKKAQVKTAKRIMFANSNGKRLVICDLHGCPSRTCNKSNCCNNFVAEAKKIIKENKS
ncbi:hypothetical protein NO1_1940 [Candidatus Termititenax aidoneus]|uniref:Uncharacterized protein n=1 Tax=Termititenax aidoneus TaxID=2218524 RepID=A0A388TEA4_TERA1|nr:hypothetical protein NO1_1940 [Candidatus Termititenax aidoneus]